MAAGFSPPVSCLPVISTATLLSAGYGFDVGNLAPLPAMFSSSPSNVDDLVLPVPFAWEEGLQVIRLEPDGKVDGAF